MKSVWVVFLGIFLVGCGTSNPKQQPLQSSKTLIVEMFSAPWCAECNADLPKLQQLLKHRGLTSAVRVQVWMTTGTTASKPATAEGAENYRKSLKLDFSVLPDLGWKLYETYYSGRHILPGGVVLRQDGTTVKVFEAGRFTADQVVAFAEAELRKN